jgi:hypothetical protein
MEEAGDVEFESPHLHTSTRRPANRWPSSLINGRVPAARLRSQKPQTVQGEWLEVPPVQGDELQPVGRRRCGDPQVVARDRPAERLRCRAEPAILDRTVRPSSMKPKLSAWNASISVVRRGDHLRDNAP